jgi:DTW domain-containing protein YfiP
MPMCLSQFRWRHGGDPRQLAAAGVSQALLDETGQTIMCQRAFPLLQSLGVVARKILPLKRSNHDMPKLHAYSMQRVR